MPVPWIDRDPKKSKETSNLVLTLLLGSLAIAFFPLVIIYFLLKGKESAPQKFLAIICFLAIFGLALEGVEKGVGFIFQPSHETSSEDELFAKTNEIFDKAFHDAINDAMRAAEMTQSATTLSEWEHIAAIWRQVIGSMKATPDFNENYKVAQQKAVEYQEYLEYAEQQVENSRRLEIQEQ